MVDQKQEALKLSKYFFSVPSYRHTLMYLLAWCFLAGFAIRLAYKPISFAAAFIYGGTEGILLLGFPAFLSAILATALLSRKELRKGFKYYSFLSLACSVLTATAYFTGLIASKAVGVDVALFVFIANGFVFIVWFLASFIALNLGWRALPISFLQPFFNIAFLFLWSKFGAIEVSFEVGSPLLALLKLFIASIILLLALWSFFFVLNAPVKRNFGVSAIQAATLFFAQALRGSKAFESVLAEMSEPVNTEVGVVFFKKKAGAGAGAGAARFRAVFVVPGVHCGPFGDVGGSEFPFLVSKAVEEKFSAPAFVFHAPVNHDFNPVYSSDVKKLIAAVQELARTAGKNGFCDKAGFVESRAGSASVFGLSFCGNAFLTLSRAPQSTEDLDYGLGAALRNAGLKNFKECLVVDRHNSLTTGERIYAGSPEYCDYETAVKNAREPREQNFLLGVASDSLAEFTPRQGIGRMGLRVAVFEAGGKRACFVLVDANNARPEFRQKIVSFLKQKHGFHWVDLLTSDTHSVNSISGVFNPLPSTANQTILLKKIDAAVERALRGLEPAEASLQVKRISLNVLGAERQSELITTINSIVAVAKILAPVILVASLALVAVALLLLK